MPPDPRAHLPPRLLPVLYFGAAHLALAVAFAVLAADPRAASGFFYHPWMLALVHLVTLGWIGAATLGTLIGFDKVFSPDISASANTRFVLLSTSKALARTFAIALAETVSLTASGVRSS